ncbi:zinc-binding dehydrogenase [Pseudooceanicola sp. 216_PA32_1]|uniref:Zinc-binding dehydrogenase n=1 Tax=Pseudooceanicola pacificus TaxID=2676438 RepID=A0A844WBF5_9RHOB|nr:quinone oxidoreductase [Pseudooceanicola pacificus]MWB78148.1 zinc-binding dehydrogenase [Pseudooceanicola pacificus]
MTQMNAILIHRNGGPEEMVHATLPRPVPSAGQVLVRHTAIGVNFSDINVRRGGFYTSILSDSDQAFPLVLGNEAAGVVEETGPGVTGFAPGDRVAYAGMHGQFFEQSGAYCDCRAVPADRLVPVPDTVTDQQAAAVLLKGSTASLIINRLRKPAPGDVVLVHAAASGVGALLAQWAHHLGARVIGTAGSDAKARIARDNGCEAVVLYKQTEFTDAVLALAPGGVDIVYDGVGADTFHKSIGVAAPFGTLVNYGNASGPVSPLDIQRLAMRSLSVARAGVTGHIGTADDLRRVAAELFELVAAGALRPRVHQAMPLRDAAESHRMAESGQAAGALLLLP